MAQKGVKFEVKAYRAVGMGQPKANGSRQQDVLRPSVDRSGTSCSVRRSSSASSSAWWSSLRCILTRQGIPGSVGHIEVFKDLLLVGGSLGVSAFRFTTTTSGSKSKSDSMLTGGSGTTTGNTTREKTTSGSTTGSRSRSLVCTSMEASRGVDSVY